MTPILAIGIGPPEILLILLAAILLFGASRIPQIGQALGQGIRNFKKGVGGEEIDITPDKIEGAPDSATADKKSEEPANQA